MSLPAGSRLGHYQVLPPLGAGGMGEVYCATDTNLGRSVAIKVLPADVARDVDRLARFEREAKLLASLNHPHIARVYGFEAAPLDGSAVHFLAMELVEGEVPQDVSQDGQWLLFLQTTAVNRRSVGILPLARPQEARLFSGEEGAASFASFSPDGRFIAFQSDASGREKVYVRPVAGNARGVPVSGGGGQLPRWGANGDLFFWQGDLLVTVQVRTSPTLQIGAPRPLFRTARERPNYYDCDYDVSADGQSIYLTRTPDLLRPRELRVVTDWGTDVTALFARGGN